uniref:Retrovirus-related Pol polyprotein from transposon TNT 1-94 n=1 Tax=Tanacetum cinerariifolium TaxID=118510 RepID=A0A6L2NBV1_TANCI|nr:retrovirus-related Pol polyprotein from transposon TNT 1-94 [Tanacetum cinerariifolium]
MGYGDYKIGNVTISRVYYVEGLGQNLFSMRQFCDSYMEDAFRQHTCFICNLDGVDLLTDSRGNDLYTLSLQDIMASSPICLLSKASKTKSWLWHHHLSHLNFGAINHLARQGLVKGLPKLKFEKDHLCSACAIGKSKKKSYKPKSEDTNQEKLYLLHMDLCGLMCVESVNGKKYILVIVNDYSRFTWVKFLRSKDEASDFIIKFLKMIQVRLKVLVCRIRIDNGTEFVNEMLREYYETVGISHETSVARSPQQNGVVERRNRSLIEAARTIENLEKLQPKADIQIFIGYASTKKAFWIYNRIQADSIGLPSSTTVDQDAPSLSKSQTTPETQSFVIPQDVEEDNLDIEVGHIGNDMLFGVPILEVTSTQSSSTVSPYLIVQPDHQILRHNNKWTKDHPLHNIISQLSRPVSTRLQLHEQVLFCYYDAFLTSVEPKTYKEANGNDFLLVQIYVDDIIFAASTPKLCDLFANLMCSKFKMLMMGKISFFLGLQMSQSPRGIFINQSKYALESLKKHGFESCNPVDTSMVEKSKLDEDKEGKVIDLSHYRGMIGTLLYLTASRHDLQFAICMCARHGLLYDHAKACVYFATQPVLSIFHRLTNEDIKNSNAYKEYYAVATGAAPPKPKASVWKTRSSSDTTITPPTAAAGPRLTTFEKDEGTGSIPGVLDVPTNESKEELSWNSTDKEGDDDNGKDDDGDDDDNGDDGDDEQDSNEEEFIYPSLSTHTEEEPRDEESFDPIPKTPKNSGDEGNGEENLGLNVGREEGHDEEAEEDELYRDVNINQGRGIQTTQEFEDSYVTLTLYNAPLPPTIAPSTLLQDLPNFGSLFGFDNRLRTLEANFSEFMQTNQFAGAVSAILGIVQRYMDQRMNEAVKVTSYAIAADLSEMELKKILIEKMEGNKSIQRSNEQRNLYKALVETYEFDKIILDTYGDTVTLKRRRDDDGDRDEEPFARPDRGSKRCREGKELELASAPQETATRSTGKSTQGLVELEYHLEEVYKATTDQLDWVNPEGQQYPHNLLKPLPLIPNNQGHRVIPFDHFINNDLEYLCGSASSRKYTTFVTKTKAAGCGHIKWIEDLFYSFAVNQESARDAYSKQRIIAVIELKIVEWHKYKHLDWITSKNALLLMSLFEYLQEASSSRGVWKTFNWVSKATRRSSRKLKRKEAYTAYSNPRGFIYQNKDKKNRLMWIDELHKFSDGTLTDVRTVLDDHLKRI